MNPELTAEENAQLQKLIDLVTESDKEIDDLQDEITSQFTQPVIDAFNAMFGISPSS